jgi:hypothetical protein
MGMKRIWGFKLMFFPFLRGDFSVSQCEIQIPHCGIEKLKGLLPLCDEVYGKSFVVNIKKICQEVFLTDNGK